MHGNCKSLSNVYAPVAGIFVSVTTQNGKIPNKLNCLLTLACSSDDCTHIYISQSQQTVHPSCCVNVLFNEFIINNED